MRALTHTAFNNGPLLKLLAERRAIKREIEMEKVCVCMCVCARARAYVCDTSYPMHCTLRLNHPEVLAITDSALHTLYSVLYTL